MPVEKALSAIDLVKYRGHVTSENHAETYSRG